MTMNWIRICPRKVVCIVNSIHMRVNESREEIKKGLKRLKSKSIANAMVFDLVIGGDKPSTLIAVQVFFF